LFAKEFLNMDNNFRLSAPLIELPELVNRNW